MKKLLIFIAFLLLIPLAVQAAPAWVQGTGSNCGSVATCTLHLGSNVTAGNILIMTIRVGGGQTLSSVTSTQGDTFSQAIVQTQTTDNHKNYIEYAPNLVGGNASVTVNISSANTLRFTVDEYSGIATASPLDVATSSQGNASTTYKSGSITTTNASDLIYGGATNANSGGTFTAGSGFNARQKLSCGAGQCVASEDQTVSLTTTTQAVFTNNVVDNWTAGVAAFKGTAAASGATNATQNTMASIAGIFQSGNATFKVGNATFQVQ